jgi:Uma2 family endonuclease
MNLRIPTSPKSEMHPSVIYAESDGEPMAETETHFFAIIDLAATLHFRYRSQPHVYVVGNMFLYYEEGNPEARKAPDLMVVKGVDTSQPRRSFKVWEEKAVPCVIIEFTSKKIWEEDLGTKKAVYARLGVNEYFLFDPLHEYLDQPLKGYRLVGVDYALMERASEGGLVSEELELRLHPEGGFLRLHDIKTGERILAPGEWYDLAKKAQDQAQQELDRAEKAEHLAEQEKRRAEAAEKENARLLAEIERLKGKQK